MTAKRLLALGFAPVVAPVLQAQALAWAHEAAFDALAFTSQAAVAAFAAACPQRDARVFAVGEATAQAARQAGFVQVEAPSPDGPAKGDVRALADRIAAAAPRPAMVLNPTAREPAADLPALLADRGVSAAAVAVYQTVATDLAAAPDDLAGVLIHSAKAARAAVRLIAPKDAAAMTAWAISEAAAAPLQAAGFNRIAIAAQPTEAALLAAIRP